MIDNKKCISALQGVRRTLVFKNSKSHLSAVKLREEILGNHTLDDIMKQSSRFKEVSTSGKKETESGKAVV